MKHPQSFSTPQGMFPSHFWKSHPWQLDYYLWSPVYSSQPLLIWLLSFLLYWNNLSQKSQGTLLLSAPVLSSYSSQFVCDIRWHWPLHLLETRPFHVFFETGSVRHFWPLNSVSIWLLFPWPWADAGNLLEYTPELLAFSFTFSVFI